MPTLTEDLATILSTVQRPGGFCMSDRIDLLPPGIHVDGVGAIALPLLPAQAEQLIAAAERAPYGRGAETLVDTAVRRTWQIGADRIRIGGKHWPRTLEDITERAATGLGVSGPVAAELYKLLLYDEGSFFVSHRDTEKAPGMFATLVVALPSQSSGGQLLVRHKGKEAKIDLHCEEPSEIAFAAFYADCVHEVLPVVSGCRASLVFNLVRTGKGARPKPPDYDREAVAATALLRRWADGENTAAPLKLIYPLEHAYTVAELGFNALKGADAATAGVLATAAPQAGCDVHLALVTIEESGSAEYTGYSSRWVEPELEAGEVFDRYEALCEWRSPDGASSALTELPIKEDEVSPSDALDDMEPDEEHFHEATGNEGASFERTYRRAALVLWPSKQALAVVNQAGLSAALLYLADLIGRWRERDGGASDSPLRAQALELSGHMLASWPATTRRLHDSEAGGMAQLFALLAQLGDTQSIDRLIGKLTAQCGHGKSDNEAILDALELFAPEEAALRLRRIVVASGVRAPGACAALLAAGLQSRFASAPRKLADALAALVEALPGDPARTPKDEFGEAQGADVDADLVANLIRALDTVGGPMAPGAARHLLAWPGSYPLDKILVPAARRLAEAGATVDSEAFEILRAACLAHLQRRAAEPLEPPRDWSRANAVSCGCQHCAALGRFLADPERPTWNLKAAEDIRRHVEATIRNTRSDVDATTDRRGRPYALVCAKNQASYERRAAQRKKDHADIATLERCATQSGGRRKRSARQ